MSDAQTEPVEETRTRLQDVPDWDYLLREFERKAGTGTAAPKPARAKRRKSAKASAVIYLVFWGRSGPTLPKRCGLAEMSHEAASTRWHRSRQPGLA